MKIASDEPATRQPPRATLWDVPDLCLIKIFEQFTLKQLFAAANVCVRFRQIAVSAYRARCATSYVDDTHMAPVLFVSCLRIFSPSNVRVQSNTVANIFGAIAEYCHNIESLTIRGQITHPHALIAARSLLPQLKQICVTPMDIWNEAADVDWQLERLLIHNPNGGCDYSPMPLITFAKLRELKLSLVPLRSPSFVAFIATHWHLELLELRHCTMGLSQLRWIAEYLPNLRTFTCFKLSVRSIMDDDTSEPCVFKRLEKLTIRSYNGSIPFILNSIVGSPVKYVDLMLLRTEAIDGLRQLPSVSRLTLRLFAPVPVADVLDVTNAMRGLQVLHVHVGEIQLYTLGCIKRLIEQSQRIAELSIRWHIHVAAERAPELEAIAAAIAAHPSLCVVFEVPRRWFGVGSFVLRTFFCRRYWNGSLYFFSNLFQQVSDIVRRKHAAWLKVIDCPEPLGPKPFFDYNII